MDDKIQSFLKNISPQEKKYYMYYHLVQKDTDIVGMIAYCKYKTSKIEHIIDFQKTHKRKPNDEELAQFQQHQSNPATISAYKASALKTFEMFQATTFDNSNKEYERKLKELTKKEKLIDDITKKCPAKKHGGGFWLSVLASGVSTFILGFLYIVLWLNGVIPSIFSYLQNIPNK